MIFNEKYTKLKKLYKLKIKKKLHYSYNLW